MESNPRRASTGRASSRRRATAGRGVSGPAISHIFHLLAAIGLALVIVLLAGAGDSVLPGALLTPAARQAQAQLEGQIAIARDQIGVPSADLAPIQQQIRAIADGTWSGSGDGDSGSATARFTQLYSQVLDLELASVPRLRDRISLDLGPLTLALASAHDDGCASAGRALSSDELGRAVLLQSQADQARYDAVTAAAAQAATPLDIAAADAAVRAQTTALSARQFACADVRALEMHVHAAQVLGVDVAIAPAWLAADVQALAAGVTEKDYTRLRAAIAAQESQLSADELAALVAPGAPALGALQAAITGLGHAGAAVGDFQRAHDADLAALGAAHGPAEEAALARLLDAEAAQVWATQLALQAAITGLGHAGAAVGDFQRAHDADHAALAVVHGPAEEAALARLLDAEAAQVWATQLALQAHADLATLTTLIHTGASQTLLDPANGQRFAADYPYASPERGIGALKAELADAVTVPQIEQADSDIRVLLTNLHAMLANMRDGTAPSKPHAADLSLLAHYGAGGGKAVVVSLAEQVARFYDDGRLVSWTYVTTGRPERPSPPGIHYAMDKRSPLTFTSPEPRSSPFWFAPTPVKYAINYEDGGFYLHDGWWRNKFGPGTELPHYDPIAFNGGSHGCINFPSDKMPWVYNWVDVGTPIVVY